jgi:hypothetical protein
MFKMSRVTPLAKLNVIVQYALGTVGGMVEVGFDILTFWSVISEMISAFELAAVSYQHFL